MYLVWVTNDSSGTGIAKRVFNQTLDDVGWSTSPERECNGHWYFCSSLDTEAVSSARMCSDVYRYTLDLLENEKVIHVLLKARELFRDTCSRVIYDLGLQVAASNG